MPPAQNTCKNTFTISSPNTTYTDDEIHSKYVYRDANVTYTQNGMVVTPYEKLYEFKTDRNVPRLGLMMVGWGGNNGSTVTASILANKHKISWRTKEGVQNPSYFGSITQASTFKIGVDPSGKDVFVPFSSMLPMADPNDFVIGGWDISSMNLGDAMERAGVLDYDLQRQIKDMMIDMKPLPSIYYPDFIAANQGERADNILKGTKLQNLDQIRQDIREFKSKNNLDQVVVVWTANTERYADIIEGVNDTSENLLQAIKDSHPEVSPSTVFAMASIMESCPFINGSPQNTFVPGALEFAMEKNVFIGGDDFKSGQTKLKSVLVDFLVNAGIKPLAITSYNHLGNNDGKNLSSPLQFRSKEISKSNVVDDMVDANRILYAKGEHPDHTVVIKYSPAVGDSKRALDEYYSEIFMGGRSTISIYNVCEDSLLASPLIIDLAVMAELFTRITYKAAETNGKFKRFHPVLSVLSYMLKAPVVPAGTPVVNALGKQRQCVENIMRACLGLAAQSEMMLEHKCI